MKGKIQTILWVAATLIFILTQDLFPGNLEPDAPPGSTMKTLDQVAPCIPIQDLPSDSAALFIIHESGSYYLTGNIQGESGKYGIRVLGDNVFIDLRGFTLQGVPGSRDGICFDKAEDGARSTGGVMNGTIQLWGQHGISAKDLVGGSARDIISQNNGGGGIVLGKDSLAMGCLVRENGSFGIEADDSSLIKDCSARNNHYGGIKLYSGGIVQGCVAEGNSEGIYAVYEARITHCNLSFNRWGIVVRSACYVHKNNLAGNGEVGIRCGGNGGRNRIDENNVTGSNIGIQVESANKNNILLRNTVTESESGAAFQFQADCQASYGPIVKVKGLGDFSSPISPVTNGDHPWANLVY